MCFIYIDYIYNIYPEIYILCIYFKKAPLKYQFS